MIVGEQNICDVFSVFHDGEVRACSFDGSNLVLEVEIEYLAKLIEDTFRHFRLTLHSVQNVQFETWPNDPSDEPSRLSDVREIFDGRLQFLGGELAGDGLQVACNQAQAGFTYCGGTLRLAADSASVSDEAGAEYSIGDLRRLSAEYWDKWEAKHASSGSKDA